MQLLTNSRRTSYNDCPRKHFFAYELSRRPAVTSDALRFGSLMHNALELWWREASIEPVLEFLDSATEDDNTYEIAKARALIVAYNERYRDDHEKYEVVEVEHEFRAPLINPRTNHNSQTWLLAGKIDVIVRERSTGAVIIIEHKTTSDSIAPDSDYWLRLTIDGQISGYYVGAETSGYSCECCVYDVIKKPMLKPALATPEDQRKYTKDGKLYSNQRDTDETVEEYYDRLTTDIASRPDFYFCRRETVRLGDDLEDYMKDMWSCGREIRNAQITGYWRRNVGACNRYGMCEYFGVCCKYASINDDTLFVTLDNINPELSPPKEEVAV
jgi:hypothetical protein